MEIQSYNLVLAGLLIMTLGMVIAPVSAADITIYPGDSIQDAINYAHPGDTIILNPGRYPESGITVSKDITIRASGTAADTVIDAGGSGRIFTVSSGSTFAVDNLSMINGTEDGGAIYNNIGGTLSVSSSTFENFAATGSGGAIINYGTASLTSSTFSRCSAATYGGAVYNIGGILTVTSSTFSSCPASYGGAIANTGTVSVTSSTFENCSASYGGAITNTGTVSVTSSTFSRCWAANYGAAIYNIGGILTVTSSTFSSCLASYGGAITNTGTVSVTSSTFENCSALALGGAIFNIAGTISVTSSTFSNCSALTVGGAVYNNEGSTSIHFSRLNNNTAIMLASHLGSINAANNWWGTNDNPSGYIAFDVTVSPWLVLNITAAPSEIATGGSSAIRINITNNSAGTDTTGGGIFVPDGIPVAYELTSGTGSLAPLDGTITTGANTTLFTNADIGTSTVTATVDGLPVSTGITISSPFHTLNPGDSIQQNITDALDGDTIILNPGTYRESGIVVPKNITILANTSEGGSAADTVIDGMAAAGIFTVSPGVAFTVENLSLQNGTAAKGGAINAGSDSVVSLSSSSIANCSATTAGGAIYAFHGTVDITSSSLAGCSATNYGGAISASGSTVTVTSSALTGSSAPYGGAVYAGGSTVNVHFSRLYNNTATMLWSSGGTVDAPDNWWGTNDDPSGFTSGTVTVDPWLVFNISAAPSSISTAQTSKIRTNLTRNSAGTDTTSGGIFVPAGIPVAFALTGGTGSVLPQNGNITSGANTTTFTPAGAGTSTITATVDGQTVSTGITVSVPPTITSITPNSGPTKGNTSITIRGTNFVSGGLFGVKVGGIAATSVVRINATTITAKTPAGSAGARNIVVTNKDGQTATRPSGFTYIAPPTITSITPNSGPTKGNTSITIKGTNFVSGGLFGVKIGGTAATSVVRINATTITAKTPAGSAGARNVVVTNKDGQTATRPSGFTYIAPPTITSITPNSGPTKGNTSITIRGTNFVSGGSFGVKIGGVAATSVVRVNATAIKARTPAGIAGARTVLVTNKDGQTATKPGGFTYIAPPTITSITPNSGPTTGNTLVTIRGTKFVSGGLFGVKIGGAAATSVVRVNATAIKARTPASLAGARTVVVTNKDGQTATKPSGFTYL